MLVLLAGMAFFLGSLAQAQVHHYFPTVAERDAACAQGSNTLSSGWVGWTADTVPPAFSWCPPRAACYHYLGAGPDQHWYHHLQDCGAACPSGYTPDPSNGECLEEPQASCPTGERQKFHSDTSGSMPTDVCSNGCWYTAEQDQMVMMDITNGGWVSEFTSTGAQCALQTGESGGGGSPEDCIIDSQGNYFCPGDTQTAAAPNCIESVGFEACINQQDPQNCGYINNHPVCFNDVPDGECTFIPGGSYICASDNPDPFQLPTPPAPNTGTPGVPVSPDVIMSGNNIEGPDNYFYYDETTVNNSSGSGGAPGPDSYESGGQGGGCEPGSPDCPAHIDEEGVPESSGTSDNQRFDETLTGLENLAGDLSDIGSGGAQIMSDPPTSLVDLDGLFPPVAACQNPSLAFFGQQITFDICEELLWLRDFMAWVFYLITAFGIFHIAMDLRGIG